MKIRKILSITALTLLLTAGIGWSTVQFKTMSKAGNTVEKCITACGSGPICIDMDVAIAEYMIKYPVQFNKLMKKLRVK
jgi:hypothetical protein